MKYTVSLFLLLIFIISCGQDPIFFTISEETAPTKPRIEGSPSNMVVFEREYPEGSGIYIPLLCVASGWRLHWYNEISKPQNSAWNWEGLIPPPIPKPVTKKTRPGEPNEPIERIMALAATKDYLYVLVHVDYPRDYKHDNTYNKLMRIGKKSDDQWTPITVTPEYNELQTVFANPAENKLFAGSRRSNSNNFGILFLDENETALRVLHGETGLLTGIASDGTDYYMTTGFWHPQPKPKDDIFNSGIYKAVLTIDSIDVEKMIIGEDDDNSIGYLFSGIICLPNLDILAVRNTGSVHILQDDRFVELKRGDDTVRIGNTGRVAFAIWEGRYEETDVRILLASKATAAYDYGYIEFPLNTDGSLDLELGWQEPGKIRPSTVEKNTQYSTSIGKHPIKHLFQVPGEIDPDMILFASTQSSGLWSYKNRPNTGGWQWNAEE